MQKSQSSSPAQRPMAARARALAIKKAQEEALIQLPLDTLYIVLYIRSDPPQPNDFHWGYYFHTSLRGGAKYHISNLSGGWIPSHESTHGVFKSNFLCALVKIATVPKENHSRLDQIMKSRDGDVNAIPSVTCRVWVMTILQTLIQHGIVRCSNNVYALQHECMEFGNEYSVGAANNEQPRPVVESRLCI
ncbi:hypothetical protein DTO271G3_2556 [Paecilomyces variotii]|nr:hypothetical protein DTO271G3_2556 [Paecilomyces variotii]